MLGRIVAALALSLALASAAVAAELTAEQRSSLETRIAGFEQGVLDSDMSVVIHGVPDAMLETIVKPYNMTIDEFVTATQAGYAQALKTIKIVSFEMDLSAAQIESTADGAPYALIPTDSVVDRGLGNILTKSDTLAFLEQGKWYLLRTEDPRMVDLFKKTYPAFADVDIKPATSETVTQ